MINNTPKLMSQLTRHLSNCWPPLGDDVELVQRWGRHDCYMSATRAACQLQDQGKA